MANIQVVTDSACDLNPSMTEAHDVRVVPLAIRFGSEELVDREELSVKEFWDRVITGPDMPETAAPSPGAFRQAYIDAAEAGADGVICITLSSGLSATFQAATTAATDLPVPIAVKVVDSQSVTLGEGLLALAASDMARDGRSLDDIVTEIESLRDRTHVYGVLGGLDFLKKGGRIGGASHLMGSLLSIKPVIEIREGVVEVESKQRTRSRSLQYLAGKALEAGPLERLGVANGVADDIDELLSILASAHPEHEMVVSDLGPVIGSHAGPGTVGVCFQVARTAG
ncbi:MAG TPA: DegV family protein [Acidimicrobiales bacterium]|nr:DegV family protein [Acidimicrobiales bacterium]